MYMSFIELCRKLSKAKRCGCDLCTGENEYLCAYNAVKQYVQGDKNKLLKLKAECAKENFGEFLALLVAILAFYISAIECITSFFNVEYLMWCKIVALALFLGFMIWGFSLVEKFKCVSRWKSYIAVAIEVLEKELDLVGTNK